MMKKTTVTFLLLKKKQYKTSGAWASCSKANNRNLKCFFYKFDFFEKVGDL